MGRGRRCGHRAIQIKNPFIKVTLCILLDNRAWVNSPSAGPGHRKLSESAPGSGADQAPARSVGVALDRRQISHLILGEVEANPILDGADGADRDQHALSAPEVSLGEEDLEHAMVGGVDD